MHAPLKSNRAQIIDLLGEIKAQIADLQAYEDELKAQLAQTNQQLHRLTHPRLYEDGR